MNLLPTNWPRHCGFTQTIGAVTNVHTTHTLTNAETGALVRTGAVVFTAIGGNYKQIGDKVIFYPREDARWNNPHDPIKNPSLPSSNKARLVIWPRITFRTGDGPRWPKPAGN
jgi:hypothetical protein